eukprot:CAMPEP_0116574078 /NCGR_PEP_ID=MMETSP0397-20121206/19169_1 /TAXON_ID=216820 /ORGANISM="Cyclophora tenuis, Strain ECT3854" /LENGTH=147 /DNA_ID=CAMNT_0004102753 /DNA_START=193 /DNA_END=633 /DNA_ORIENTATION=+
MLRQKLTDSYDEREFSTCHGPISNNVTEGEYSGCCSHYVQWWFPHQYPGAHVAPGCVPQRGVGVPPERPCAFNLLKLKGLRQKVAPRYWFIRKVLPYAQLVLENETRIPLDIGLPTSSGQLTTKQPQQEVTKKHNDTHRSTTTTTTT